MKQKFMRVLSCLLAIALLLPIAAELPISTAVSIYVYADDTVEEEILEAQEDANVGYPNSAGDWTTAREDGCSWNYFHNQVQKHIETLANEIELQEDTETDFEVNFQVEFKIFFNKLVENPVTKKESKKGKADFAMKIAKSNESNIAYLWEIKPASYSIEPNKSKGINQLKNYTNNKLHTSDMIQCENGSTYEYASEKLFFVFNGIFESTTKTGVKYKITYKDAGNGLILYWFEKINDDDDKKEEEEEKKPILLPNKSKKEAENDLDNRSHKIRQSKKEDEEEQEEPEKQDWASIIYTIVAVKINSIPMIPPADSGNMVYSSICNKCISAAFLYAYAAEMSAASGSYGTSVDKSQQVYSAMLLSGAISLEDYADFLGTIYGDSIFKAGDIYEQNKDIDNVMELTKSIQNNSYDYEKAGKAQPPRDPLIIDLGESGIELRSLEHGVNFDLDNSGFAEKTAWIGTEDGFLALDRNGNGSIDNGGELFGDQVIIKDGSKSESGFEALAELDDNGDGIIDNKDSAFANLRVWIDANHNGKSESNELKTLNETGVISISLEHSEVSIVDEETGTRIAESASVTINKNGAVSTVDISEFWFPVNSSDTTQDGVVTAGNVPNIIQAVNDDESGELLELFYEFSESTDIAMKRYYLKKILYKITDSENIAINSRGGNIDARDLHVIEQFMGRDFEGVGGSNPNSNAASILKDIYTNIENQYYNILNMYCGLGGYLNAAYEYEDENGNKNLNLEFLNYIFDEKAAEGENIDYLVYDLGVYLKSYDKINGTSCFIEYSNHYSENYADIVELTKSGNTYLGTESNDSYNGTNKNDFIFGEGGNDNLHGGNGNEAISGGSGNDTHYL